jgi:hypothetical protein
MQSDQALGGCKVGGPGAMDDMSELQQYAQCFQYEDPHANPPDF